MPITSTRNTAKGRRAAGKAIRKNAFRKLPKAAKRAAFAAMDRSGVGRPGKKKGKKR